MDRARRGFADLALPILSVHGADDPIAPVADARAWSARLPQGRIVEFAGARHDVLNETVHREVAAAITDFVSRWPTGSRFGSSVAAAPTLTASR